MSHADQADDPQPKRLVYRAMERMQMARAIFWEARAEGTVNGDVSKGLQVSLMQYYDALRRYRNKGLVAQEWEKGNFDRLRRMAMEDETVQAGNSKKRGAEAPTQAKPKQIPPLKMVEMSYDLDDIATKLGFAARIPIPEGHLEDPI